ncbi:MMPL family transporter [Thermogymnomonas acidicola]|uniref:MMPL family transporter n=1 Tax=Thermogymnomonas acidicola TaxID=399579 RepID=UPI0009467E1D|nr:MMPL family transporter [Thermogymnomonas acidicola]
MFERAFRRLALTVTRHSGKVIIIWLVILVLSLPPFAGILFNDTSYNIASDIVPANSMANTAQNLFNTYFGGGGNASSNSTLVIVTNGTPIDSVRGGIDLLASLQGAVASYLDSLGSGVNITSFLTVENETLQSFSNSSKALLNGTYSLLSTLNAEESELNQTTVGLAEVEYGLPAVFIRAFNASEAYGNVTVEDSVAYHAALSAAGDMPAQFSSLATSYLDLFSYAWNSTVKENAPYSVLVQTGSGIVSGIDGKPNGGFYRALNTTEPLLANITAGLAGNVTLEQYVENMQQFNSTLLSFSRAFAVNYTSSSLGNNSRAEELLSALNLTPPSYIAEQSWASGKSMTGPVIEGWTVSDVEQGLIDSFSGNPEVQLNTQTLTGYLTALNGTSPSKLASYTILSGSYLTYPIVLTPAFLHQFVGYDNSTTIILISTQFNLTPEQVNTIQAISDNFKSVEPDSRYYVAGASALDQEIESEAIDGLLRALIIGIAISVVIVGIFFRSPVAAFLPLSMFGMSAVISSAVDGLIYRRILHSTVSFITPTLLYILLLGLTSDYIVYIMARYRREVKSGNPEAIVDAGQWAGNAVLTSGLTVAISYIILWLADVPLFSDSGLVNAIGVAVAILIATTFFPALLKRAGGPRVFWPRHPAQLQSIPMERTMWRISRAVLRNKGGKIAVVFIVVSVIALYVYLITPTNMDVFRLIPPQSSGVEALQVVNDTFHGDFFDRGGYVIVKFPSPLLAEGKYNMTEMAYITGLEENLSSVKGVSEVFGPSYPFGYYVNVQNVTHGRFSSIYNSTISSDIGSNPDYAMVTFQLSQVAWDQYSSNTVKDIVKDFTQGSRYPAYVGGLTEGGLNAAYSATLSAFLKIIPILRLPYSLYF